MNPVVDEVNACNQQLKVPTSVKASQLAAIAKLSKMTSALESQEEESSNVDLVPESFKCAVCLELIVKPRKCFPCRHSFCEPCIRSFTVTAKSRFGCLCPLCRQNILYTFPDKETEKGIKASNTTTLRAYKHRMKSADRKLKKFKRKKPLPGLSSIHCLFKCCYANPRVSRFCYFLVRFVSIVILGQHSATAHAPAITKIVDVYFAIFCLFHVPLTYTLISLYSKYEPRSQRHDSHSWFGSSSLFPNGTAIVVKPITLINSNTTSGNGTGAGDFPELNLTEFPGYVLLCICLMCVSRMPFQRIIRHLQAFHATKVVFAVVVTALVLFHFASDAYLTVTLVPFFVRFPYPSGVGFIFGAIVWIVLLTLSLWTFCFKHEPNWGFEFADCSIRCFGVVVFAYGVMWYIISNFE